MTCTLLKQMHTGDGMSNLASAAGISATSGLLGWAVSSLTATKAKTEIGTPATSQPLETTSTAKISSNSVLSNETALTATSVSERPPPPPVSVYTSSYQPETPAVASPTSDGWGEIRENGNGNGDDDDYAEGWGDMGLLEEPSLARIQAAQQIPVAAPKTQMTTTTHTVKSSKEFCNLVCD
ncbi:hypothetical protein Mapa_010394 [Marchantia paleacea]|nr:hypothetical protein Mapa_010394 [Marchantia paleacea]